MHKWRDSSLGIQAENKLRWRTGVDMNGLSRLIVTPALVSMLTLIHLGHLLRPPSNQNIEP